MTDTLARQSLAEHALAYAQANLPVLPLRPSGKLPASAHGKDDATTDFEQVARWWAENPRYNIGIRPPAGLFVLDVDPRHGGAVNLWKLNEQHGSLPETWTCKTGGNGLHIWLRGAGPFRGQLCEGVDIKSDRGYLVAPPSIHPDTGNHYEWGNALPIAHAPSWVLKLARVPVVQPRPFRPARASSAGAGAGLVRAVADAQPGNRNHMLYWAAMCAREDELLDQLRVDLVDAARSIGLTDREIASTLRSAENGGRR